MTPIEVERLRVELKRMHATNRALEGVPGGLAVLCHYGAADFELAKLNYRFSSSRPTNR